MKWFDRALSFDISAWMYPNVIERLRGTPARVDQLIQGLATRHLTGGEEGRWSIQENIGHLMDLEELWLGRVDDILEGKTRMRDADLTNRKTHAAGHNDQEASSVLASFSGSRARLVARLETVGDGDIERSALHPRLERPMRLIDLAFFVAEHDDHHLAEISRLKRYLNKPNNRQTK
jgi:uncharacterized damage-inducible protein DinB